MKGARLVADLAYWGGERSARVTLERAQSLGYVGQDGNEAKVYLENLLAEAAVLYKSEDLNPETVRIPGGAEIDIEATLEKIKSGYKSATTEEIFNVFSDEKNYPVKLKGLLNFYGKEPVGAISAEAKAKGERALFLAAINGQIKRSLNYF